MQKSRWVKGGGLGIRINVDGSSLAALTRNSRSDIRNSLQTLHCNRSHAEVLIQQRIELVHQSPDFLSDFRQDRISPSFRRLYGRLFTPLQKRLGDIRCAFLLKKLAEKINALFGLSDFLRSHGLGNYPARNPLELLTFEKPAASWPLEINRTVRFPKCSAWLRKKFLSMSAFDFQSRLDQIIPVILRLQPDFLKHDAIAAKSARSTEAGRSRGGIHPIWIDRNLFQ